MSYESIKNDTPLKLKEKSASFEQNISKELYRDFSLFRTHLFENIVKNNDLDKALLLRLTQKLCDRIIFILFAEDRGLLTPNTVKEIRERHSNDGFGDRSMYDYYKLYFNAINQGNEKLKIPKYNGGLFAHDETLDSLIIDDAILDMEAQKLSDYDFMSDIGVNILGHIFEQSLTDLEEINASINDTEFDAKKSKRKKDGVFYTPEYITKYIVDNTLGKLCDEKRQELNIGSETLVSPKNLKKPTKQELSTKENLEKYRDWLLNLKILDPACGSGAFLNQALDFLIREHEALQKDLVIMGDITAYYEIEKSILEHNLYGVDINEDAVEIAKLSLWLRTASKGRELTTLADKIVCANSLLDMPFDEGSFDVVIGNPPYIKEYTNKNAFDGLRDSECYQGKMDLWYMFGCQAIELINDTGLVGFIAPNNWISNAGASKFRNKVINDCQILEFVDFGDFKVFEDAGIQTMIYVMQKAKNNLNYKVEYSKIIDKRIAHEEASLFLQKTQDYRFEYLLATISKEDMLDKNIVFVNQEIANLLEKIKNEQNIVLDEKEVAQGIVGAPDKAFLVKENEYNNFNEDEKKYIKRFHTNAGKYYTCKSNKYVIYLCDRNFKDKQLEDFPNLSKHFQVFQDELIKAKNKYKTPNKRYFYLHRERDEEFFNKGEKVICATRTIKSSCTYTNKEFYGSRALNFIKTNKINLKYLTCILNSETANFWLKNNGKMTGDLLQIDKSQLLSIPIKNTSSEKQQPFIKLIDEILEAKQKIKDYKVLLEEAIKNDNFEREIKLKKELETIENLITTNEKEIDQMVYELYNLTEDEIKIVEANSSFPSSSLGMRIDSYKQR